MAVTGVTVVSAAPAEAQPGLAQTAGNGARNRAHRHGVPRRRRGAGHLAGSGAVQPVCRPPATASRPGRAAPWSGRRRSAMSTGPRSPGSTNGTPYTFTVAATNGQLRPRQRAQRLGGSPRGAGRAFSCRSHARRRLRGQCANRPRIGRRRCDRRLLPAPARRRCTDPAYLRRPPGVRRADRPDQRHGVRRGGIRGERCRVRAVDDSGPVIPRTVPTAPRIGTASAGAARRWCGGRRPVNDGGAAITRYTVRVYRGSSPRAGRLTRRDATSVQVTGLANGPWHTFIVRRTTPPAPGPCRLAARPSPRGTGRARRGSASPPRERWRDRPVVAAG